MNGVFAGTSILYFLGCIALGVLYAWLLYQGDKNLNKKLRYGLAILRIIGVAAIAWLLFAPLIKTLNYTLDKPVIIIGQDNSLSIGQIKAAGFDQKSYEQHLKKLQDKLSDKFEVKVYHFSDSVKDGLDFKNQGKLTDAAAFFQKIRDEYTNRNLGAIVLATDGIFNHGENPLYSINQINAPVYTVALGDSIPKRDVLISNVNYNNIVYLDDDFTIEVQVQAFQSNGESATLSVSQNGSKIQQLNIAINGNSFVKTIPVKIHAGKIGVQKYTIQLGVLPNEITTKNNAQTFYVEVIDGRQKVLLAAAAPHPDLSVLKEAITLNKHYDAKLALADDLGSIDPSKFDLIVLYQLPDAQNISANFLERLKLIKKPIWYILGANSGINAFNKIQNQVNLGSSNGQVQEIYPDFAKGFTSFSLNDQDGKIFASFDPLLSPFGRLTVNANVSSVFNQRIGQISTQQPLWFFTNDNGLKAGYLMGEGLWRWKLSEAKNEVSESGLSDLISKTIQYLSVKDDKRRFKVFTSKSAYDENEAIQFNATLYNDSYQAVNEPEVTLQIKNEAGKVFNYTFSKTDNAYQLDAGKMLAGNYSYLANTSIGGKRFTASGSFYINAVITEYQQTTANHQLLSTISKQSNGKLFMPADLMKIGDEILKNENIKTISYEDRKYDELINIKGLFALILVMLSLEWFLRKRNGAL
ncbi:hypothetical protein EV200_102137 [Pedobacter psychrotolerans]|uniref:VWA domain-containing protein n=1 Tax=Pedobacter psychrotolerans TaxID=1843235 RepID=A0A4V2RZX3_9SPHI|nr:hypothetical protein [Pedobacter psychrotolerans]TCO28720.1 hypothetical protein EV200_102137 [Pedobacter psychrotolerans]GGE51221.1 hypothetical protein GCM10011413_16920 [Pedobacter psychrotolerans]